MNNVEKALFLSFLWPLPLFSGIVLAIIGNPSGMVMLLVAEFLIFVNIIAGPLYLLYCRSPYRRLYFLLGLIVWAIMSVLLGYLLRIS